MRSYKHKIKKSGYWYIYKSEHPFTDKQGYIAEHRLVMEAHIGRYLTKKEVVHHLNHEPTDNRIENLELCASAGQHTRMHHPEVMEKLRQGSLGRTPWNKNLFTPFKKICAECDKDFTVTYKQKRKIFCSNICFQKNTSKIKRGKRLSPATEFKKGFTPWNSGLGVWIDKPCGYCQAPMKVRACRIRGSRGGYCSRECGYKGRSQSKQI